MQKTILVTGGAGFLGSHLCDLLLTHGNRVICVDNISTGSLKNIKHCKGNKNFEFINHDIIKALFLDDQKIDEVYNLACPASPVHYQSNPIRTVKANTIGVINMLGFAKKHKAKFLQASTSEVYGDPLMHPQKEDYWGNVNPIGMRSCYDEGKRVAETLCFDYHREHGVNIRIARIFNTYGPRMARNDGRIVSNFITQALTNKPITIYGDGTHTRSFCYVSDLVDGLYRLMEKSDCTGPVNLGNPNETSVLNIATLIKKLIQSTSKIVYKKIPSDDPRRRKPDIQLAKKNLSWTPKVSLISGLTKTITYFDHE